MFFPVFGKQNECAPGEADLQTSSTTAHTQRHKPTDLQKPNQSLIMPYLESWACRPAPQRCCPHSSQRHKPKNPCSCPTWKDGLANQQLRKDAAHTPDVHLWAVALCPQEQLGWPVAKNTTTCACTLCLPASKPPPLLSFQCISP